MGINAVVEADFETGYTVIVLSNFDPPSAEQVSREFMMLLSQLPSADGRPRYRVGIMFGMTPDGMMIEDVVAGAPAERAGLRGGDRVLQINGKEASSYGRNGLTELFSTPDPATFRVLRGDDELEFSVSPEAL